MSTTTTILPVEYKGYTIQEDPEYGGYQSGPDMIILFPTDAGIQHDYDFNGESYGYCGNCRWAPSITDAKEIIDELVIKTQTFTKEVLFGDAGLPVDIEITVWYTEENDTIVVHDSEDTGGPENQPTWWPEKIEQLIEDFFADKKVTF